MINIWIYDFEVFKYDWIVTFKNNDTNEMHTFHNNVADLINFYNNEIKYKAILVGYNNRHYDDYILHALLNNINPLLMNNWIIDNKEAGWKFPQLRFKKKTIISYDIMREIAIGEPISLKQMMAYLGEEIFENQIPFNIDRPLTQSELQDIINYNHYDVNSTQKLFNKFYAKFKSHYNLTERYNLEPKQLGLTAPQKTEVILQAQNPLIYDTFKFELPQSLSHLFDKGDPVLNKFLNHEFYSDSSLNDGFNFSHKMKDFDFDFGLGGGHGAIENFEYKGEIWNLDVKSYYVSLMINYDLTPRSCISGTQKLKEILEHRIKLKDNGEKEQADALKMVLVTIYGAMGFKHNKLYDPQQRASVCIVGQLLLYLLMKKLEPYCKVLQINTDGIMIIPYDKAKCKEVFTQWENDTHLELELDVGEQLFQKNVNNYIFVKTLDFDHTNRDLCDKYIKTKGMYLRMWNKQLHNEDFYQIANFTASNNLTIVDEAVVKYLVFGISVEDTIYNCKELIRFQKVVKLMSNYTNLTINNENGEYRMLRNCDIYKSRIANEEIYNGKSYRLFFVKNGFDIKRYKNIDDVIKNDSVADTSKSAIVYLNNILNCAPNELDIDYDWYIRFTKRKLNSMLNKELFNEEEL